MSITYCDYANVCVLQFYVITFFEDSSQIADDPALQLRNNDNKNIIILKSFFKTFEKKNILFRL